MKDRKTGGRKRGTPNKATVARQAQAASAAGAGVMPLEVMLSNMRFAHEQAERLMEDLNEGSATTQLSEVMKWRQIAQEAAKDAAPYVHPKLSSVEHGGNDKKPVQMRMTIQFVRAKDGRPAPPDDLPADLPPN